MQKTLTNQYHIPVLLDEVIAVLDPKPGKRFIDATMGGGGHTRALAEYGSEVLAIDVDRDAIAESKSWIHNYPTVTVTQGQFENIAEIAKAHDFTKINGVLFDLGVSSYQLDKPERGFSFRFLGPLDMRMDEHLQTKASDLLNILPESELTYLFQTFGEEHQAKRIAHAIVLRRSQQPVTTTDDLVLIITQTAGKRSGHIHAATRVFQALRIAVNSELDVLRNTLPKALSILDAQGVIAVISFHSLEDRIVKQQFAAWQKAGLGMAQTKKPLVASDEEQKNNPRSRSAKLRIFRKN